MSKVLDAALAYAARGWAVLPCHTPLPGGGCSCRQGRQCASASKHPRTLRGLHDATSDPETIREWWQRWPGANVALVTGPGFNVLDVDPRHGGEESLRQLEEERGELWTLTARSGGGGLHLYFDVDLPTRPAFLPGLDWKGRGGLIIAPPSLHASGQRYGWVAPEDLPTTPQPPPACLARLVTPPVPVVARDNTVNFQTSRAQRARYITAAVEREALAVLHAPVGERNHRLNKAAYAIARFVAVGDARREPTIEALRVAARAAGLPPIEVNRTIASALRARGTA